MTLVDFCLLAAAAARLLHGCWGGVCRVLLLPALRNAQGTHWNTGGAASQGHPVALPASCTPNIPGGLRSAIRVPVPAQPHVLSAGPPSPAHGAQRDQVHRAGRGERPSAGEQGIPGAGGGGEGSGWPPQSRLALVCPQFLQLRKSVVLTSNFAKSVVNLADMVRGGPWKEFVPGGVVPGRVNPWHLMGLSLGGFIPKGLIPSGFIPGEKVYPQSWWGLSLGVVLEGTVPSSWWICSQGVCL